MRKDRKGEDPEGNAEQTQEEHVWCVSLLSFVIYYLRGIR